MLLSYVLIADDNHAIRQSLRALLLTVFLRLRVEEAHNGHQVLDKIAEDLPDLVLMDVDMPHLDGLATTRAIKARWPVVRVIILALEPHHHALAAQAGADACVLKGVPFHELLQAVAQVGFDVHAALTGQRIEASP